MRTRALVSVLSVAVAGTLVGGVASVGAVSAPKSVKACRASSTGQLGLISKGKCPKGFKAITLGSVGPQGAPGATGPQGPGAIAISASFAAGAHTTDAPLTIGTFKSWVVQMGCSADHGVTVAIVGPGFHIGTFAFGHSDGSAGVVQGTKYLNTGYSAESSDGHVEVMVIDWTIVDAAGTSVAQIHTSSYDDRTTATESCGTYGYIVPLG